MTASLDHLRITATPLRLGAHLAPKIWGPNAEFRLDPWLLHAERHIMEAWRSPERQFLAIHAPPQVSKSTLCEVLFPLWVLGHWPDTRIINIAYSDDLAQDSGQLVRDLMRVFGAELFGLDVDRDTDSKKYWRVNGHRGGMLSVGIGSTITGKPADLITIGDLIKTMEEAASKATKDGHEAEWDGAIRARQAKMYLMASTRFSDDDLDGRLEVRESKRGYDGERWKRLNYKAVAEPGLTEEGGLGWRDFLGRIEGEPLQCRHSKPGDHRPENWEKSAFYQIRRSTTPFVWSAVYQQDPAAATGGMFPVSAWGWFDIDNPPELVVKWRVWDLAATEGGGDWTTGALVGKTADGRIVVRDMQRVRVGAADVRKLVAATAAADGVETPIMIERERSGAGKTVLEFYRVQLKHYRVEPAIPDGSKEDRARAYSVQQNEGLVLLPHRLVDGEWEPAEWVPAFIEEHRRMMGDGRSSGHDDQIDVVAYGVNKMIDSSLAELIVPDQILRGGRIISGDDLWN